MNYILCEDSGSGFDFFKCLRDICSSKEQCKVLTSYGNTKYADYLEDLIQELKFGDTLILAFDSVEVSSSNNPKNIINSANSYCKKLGVKLYYTTYYCFEELFLSYTYLEDMFRNGSYNKNDKETWCKVLHYICDSINSYSEYYVSDNALVKFVKGINNKANKTKEKFTKAVLTYISGSIYGDFKVTDSKFGNCWLKSCDCVSINNKDYRCRLCNSRFKNKDKDEKLCELEQNSLSNNAVTFSSVLSD